MSKAKFCNLSFEFMPSTNISRYHTIRIWTKLAVDLATLFLIVVLLKSHRLQFILHYTVETVTSSPLRTPAAALTSDLLKQYLVVTIRAEKTTQLAGMPKNSITTQWLARLHFQSVSTFSIQKAIFPFNFIFSKEQAEPLFRNLQTVACKGACCLEPHNRASRPQRLQDQSAVRAYCPFH